MSDGWPLVILAKYPRSVGRTTAGTPRLHAARTGLGPASDLIKRRNSVFGQSHCQAFRRYASTPSTPVSCWSDSRPSSRAQLEASSRSSQQSMDRPAPQGQQWHTTSWPVEKIHHAWSYGSDATVLDDYALTMTTNTCPRIFRLFTLTIIDYNVAMGCQRRTESRLGVHL